MLAPAAAAVGPSIDSNAATAMAGGPNLGGAQAGPASSVGQPQLGSNAGSMASGPNQGNNGGAAAGQPGTNMGAGGAGMGSGDSSHRQMGGMDSQSGMGNNTGSQSIDTGELCSPCPPLSSSAPDAGLSASGQCIASQPEAARLEFSAGSDPDHGPAGSQSRGSHQETPGTGGHSQAVDSSRREPSDRSHGSDGGMVRATEAPTGEPWPCPQGIKPASFSAIGTGGPSCSLDRHVLQSNRVQLVMRSLAPVPACHAEA